MGYDDVGSRLLTQSEDSAAPGAGGGGKCLYMFIWNVQDCPNIYSLFAVDIPDDEDSSFPNTPLLVDRLMMKPNEVVPPKLPLSPILEFPRTQYPIDMCCVELDSELYFFGGCWTKYGEDNSYPTDVYIFNPLMKKKMIKEKEEELGGGGGGGFLRAGPKMNTGKSGALPFVFDRKIYVITTSSDFYAPKQWRFEFFDPDAADGHGKWTRLKDPPDRGFINGYTVIDRKAIFLTRNFGTFSFDLDSHEWCKVSQFRPPFAIDSGVFVEDTFFTCSNSFVITSFPPISSSSFSFSSGANGSKQKDETEKLLEFFNYTNMIKLAPGVINTQLQAINRTSSFLHMKGKGNGRRFCHVLLGSPRRPDCPEIEFSSICYATITIFDALKDTLASETRTFLKAKLLYSESFLVQAKDAGAFYLIDASILPACRVQQIV